jgi:hypothetical protein
MFWGVSGRFGSAQLAELAPLLHKFAKQIRAGIFRNERT